jgi:hypothetical protein
MPRSIHSAGPAADRGHRARQPAWRVGERRAYADGVRRAWYADQIRRHSTLDACTAPKRCSR